MTLILNDFECENCHLVFEDLAAPGEPVTCPQCGWDAYRVFTKAPSLSIRMGVDAIGCPTMGDKWARMHEREAARNQDEDG